MLESSVAEAANSLKLSGRAAASQHLATTRPAGRAVLPKRGPKACVH